MNEQELDGRIQSVLDGEASPEEARELERRVAADAAARERFDELKALFGELAGMPPVAPPEGLAEKVIQQVAAKPPTASQLSARGIVFAQESDITRGEHPGPENRTPRNSPAGHMHTGGNNMSDKSFFSNRKAVIGSGIAAAAVIFGVYYVKDLPTDSSATSGTIAPATRYRAAQPTAGDVKLGEQGGTSSSSTNPVPGSANQASNQSTNQATANATNQGAVNATNQATANAANQGAVNATNQATVNAANQGAVNATNQAATNATNQATSKATNQAASQATNQAAAQATNQASSKAANQAASQMSNEAANKAANQATNKAANQAASQMSNEAANKAANQATNKAANQAASQVANEAMKK